MGNILVALNTDFNFDTDMEKEFDEDQPMSKTWLLKNRKELEHILNPKLGKFVLVTVAEKAPGIEVYYTDTPNKIAIRKVHAARLWKSIFFDISSWKALGATREDAIKLKQTKQKGILK